MISIRIGVILMNRSIKLQTYIAQSPGDNITVRIKLSMMQVYLCPLVVREREKFNGRLLSKP